MKSSALTASSASALAMLPLAIKPAPATLITQGSQGGTFRISLSARTPPSRPLTNLRISLPLGKGANGVTASLSGGSLGTENGLGGGGAGRWDVVQSLPESGGPTLVWTIDSLSSLDRPAEIQGQFYRSVILLVHVPERSRVVAGNGASVSAKLIHLITALVI